MPESPSVSPSAGRFVTETLTGYDGGRQVTVYVPPASPEAVVFAGDGQYFAQWGRLLESTGTPSTMIVGVHGLTDDMSRLNEYSPVFDEVRFKAHEEFFVGVVSQWVQSRFRVALPAQQSAVFGYSAGGELALALGLRHPEIYGTVISGSPGGGYKPEGTMPTSLPRVYLFGGTRERYFLDNATGWALALRQAGADVVMNEQDVSHGAEFLARAVPLHDGLGVWSTGRVARQVTTERPDSCSPLFVDWTLTLAKSTELH
jgi:predicted esterase